MTRHLLPVERRRPVFEGDQCSFRHWSHDGAKPIPKAALHPLRHQHQEASIQRSLRGRSQSGKFNRPPCKYFLKGTCTKSPCEYWHPPECLFYKSESGCKFGVESSFPHRQVEEQPNKKQKKGQDKSAVATVKVCDSWVACHRTLSRQIL